MYMEYRLEELFDLQMGKTPSRNKPEFWDSRDNKWISISDLSKCGKYINETKEYISNKAVSESGISQIPENTVIMSFKLSIGKVAITSEPLYSNEAIMSFKDKHVVDIIPEYLYYLLLSKDWSNGTNKAVMGATLNKATLSKIKINVHEVAKQREIVKVLDKANNIVSCYKKQLQKLDELIKDRFVEMFGLPGTDKFGWGTELLGDVCHINPKRILDSRTIGSMQVSFVPMQAVSEHGEIDVSDTRKYDDVKSGFTYFTENDVLFAKITPCMENGKGAVARGLKNGIGFGSTEFHVIRPISGKTNPYWVYTLSSLANFRKDAADNMTGSAGQRRVPAKFLEKYVIAVPPIELQQEFEQFVFQVNKSKFVTLKMLELMEKNDCVS